MLSVQARIPPRQSLRSRPWAPYGTVSTRFHRGAAAHWGTGHAAPRISSIHRMRAAVITRPGGPEVLEIRDVDSPKPGADDVLVRVRASGLNRADIHQRKGGYPAPPGSPADIPGLEFAGEVVAVGEDVRDHAIGDRVFGIVGGGAHAELIAVHARTAARIPAILSWTDAGAVPEAFI